MMIWLSKTVLIIFIHSVYSDEEPFVPLNVESVAELIRSLELSKINIWYEIEDIKVYINRLTADNLALLQESLSTGFQKHVPQCYHQSIELLVEDSMKLLNPNHNPIPCFKMLTVAKEEFEKLLNQTSESIELMIQYTHDCELYPNICGMTSTYARGKLTLREIQKKFYNLSKQMDIREFAKNCYQDLLLIVEMRIISLKLDNLKCESIKDYNYFLKRFSLWPLTLTELVGARKYSLFYKQYHVNKFPMNPKSRHRNYTSFPNLPCLNSSDTEETWMKKILIKSYNRLSVGFTRYADTLDSQMLNITNEFIDNTRELFLMIFNKKMPQERFEDPLCRQTLITQTIDQIESYSKSNLRKPCFHVIPKLVDDFRRYRIWLTAITDLVKNGENCELVKFDRTSLHDIFNMIRLFNSWEEFDFTGTWGFAKRCYNTAKAIILGNVLEDSPTIIKNCQHITFTKDIFSALPINEETYPS